jgi:hypothetical protein
MVTTFFPPNKAVEVGKTFTSVKLAELPDFVKNVSIFVVSEGDIKTYALYECDDEKTHEGYKAIVERYTGYFEIPGFKYKIEHLLAIDEALPLLFPFVENNEEKTEI